jgi:hypothetical protein
MENRMFYIKATVLLCLTLLQGCATLAESKINNALDKQYSQRANGTDNAVSALDFAIDKFCLPQHAFCTEYLIADPIFYEGDPTTKPLRVSLYGKTYFNLHVVSPKREEVRLELNPPQQRFKGTWVLLHGFSGDKSVMTINAFALRSLGFQVIVPDLQGHGAATGPTAIDGKLDAKIISQLIDLLLAEQQIIGPVYLLGHSLGANVAAKISARRQNITGQVLIAPMHDFSSGLKNYVAQEYSWYYRLLGEQQLRQITDTVLQQRNIILQDTAIAPLLTRSNTPTLLIASEQDSIAPASYFSHLQSPNLQLHFPERRTHAGLVMFNNQELQLLQDWLQTVVTE